MIKRVPKHYTRQREPRRQGDAVYQAKSFIGDDAFALLLGDTTTILDCTKELIKKYEEFKTFIIAVEEVPMKKISGYGRIRGKEVEGVGNF
jgi:UTP--glucose-1-phosphate uridylyltransferase